MTKFLMFTKESCGPCGLVKKYIRTLKDSREDIIEEVFLEDFSDCLLYTSPSPRDATLSRMPSSA